MLIAPSIFYQILLEWGILILMKRPSNFEHNRFIGDKRNQVVYDLDELLDEEASQVLIEELLENETFICFGPDTLAEARNRGYKLRNV